MYALTSNSVGWLTSSCLLSFVSAETIIRNTVFICNNVFLSTSKLKNEDAGGNLGLCLKIEAKYMAKNRLRLRYNCKTSIQENANFEFLDNFFVSTNAHFNLRIINEQKVILNNQLYQMTCRETDDENKVVNFTVSRRLLRTSL